MKTTIDLVELEQLVLRLESSGMRAFVRYSRSPKADCKRGHSLNHLTGAPEAGLSCNPLNPESWYVANGRTVQGWLAMQISDYGFMGRWDERTRAWVLTGTEVGRGSDNEPLVTDAKPIAYLSKAVIKAASEVAS